MKLYDMATEQTIIGMILVEGQKLFEECKDILTPDDFFDSRCKSAFKIFNALYQKKDPIDLVTASLYLSENPESDLSILFLTNAMGCIPVTAHFNHYVKILKDYTYKRNITKEIEKFQKSEYNPEELIEKVCSVPKYEEIQEKSNKDIMLETIEDANKGTDYKFPDNFRAVNKLLGGFDKGDLIVIGGYTSSGKSSLVTSLTYGFVNELDYKVLICTLEMPPKGIMRRIEATALKINTMKFKYGELSELDINRIKAMIPHISQFWHYNCVRVYTMGDIVRAVNKYKPDIVFIDYLQNIAGDEGLSNYEKATKHTLEIQQMTKEKGLVTFLISQFHRPQEGKIRRPYNTDFRDSGAIEERADTIFLIYWERKLKQPDLYRKDGDDPELMKLFTTKSRDGATGPLDYNLYPEYHRWIDPYDDDKIPIKYGEEKNNGIKIYRNN
jgi:replicative DNA helicase